MKANHNKLAPGKTNPSAVLNFVKKQNESKSQLCNTWSNHSSAVLNFVKKQNESKSQRIVYCFTQV